MSNERTVDLELWGRFIDKVTEQTEVGILKWEIRVTPEHRRYIVCALPPYPPCVLYFHPKTKVLELADKPNARWTISVSIERLTRFIKALGEQLSPPLQDRAEAFAREFLEER